MHRNEWQLVFFTSLSQMAVGLFMIWGLAPFLNILPPFPHFFDSSILVLILVILFLGLFAAIFHLGHPQRSVFALINLKKSWLSREALTGGIFGLQVVFLMLRNIFSQEFGWVDKISIMLGIIAGLLLVYMISRLYMLRTVPVWNNYGTPAAFYTTTFLLGTVAFSGEQIIWNLNKMDVSTEFLRDKNFTLSASIIIILLCFQFIISVITYKSLSKTGGNAALSVKLILSIFRGILLFRWGTAIIAIVLLLIFQPACLFSGWLFLPLTLVIISEFLGRWLFYLSYKRVGI
jgi:anaerobic dimethyl sulfoxide reductase subunit C (anchor subunit)